MVKYFEDGTGHSSDHSFVGLDLANQRSCLYLAKSHLTWFNGINLNYKSLEHLKMYIISKDEY